MADPKALPLKALLSFSTGEMLAFKRRGWLPSIAEAIAEVILDGDTTRSGGRRLMRNCSTGAVFWGSDPPTDFEALVETITGILVDWADPLRDQALACRGKLEAIVTARRKSLVHVLSTAIQADDFAGLQWLSDRLVAGQ
jgi:hypothetical protein